MESGIPSEIYKEHILELYRSPANYGILKRKTHEATEYNSICGDEITMQLFIEKGIVKDAKFHGSGCVISIVSASLLTDKIKNMYIREIKNLNSKDVLKLLKIKVTPARIKCMLLSLEATKRALKQNSKTKE